MKFMLNYPRKPSSPAQRLVALAVLSLASGAAVQAADIGTSDSPVSATEPRIIRGNDIVFAPPRAGQKLDGAASTYKFEDAPLLDIIHMVMRDVVKADYVVYPPINGSVTLSTTKEVSPDQALQLLESALQANGILMARDPRGTYHIGRPEALKGIVPGVRQATKDPLQPGYGTILVPLQYIGAAEMASILKPMMPPEALVRVDTLRNLLVLVGTRTQAEGWLDLVNTFDVDMLKGMSVGMFPLRYASVREVESAMRLLTSGANGVVSAAAPATSGATGGGLAAVIPAGGAGSTAGAADANNALGGMRILPIERLNAILIVTPRAAQLDTARTWIERLDRPGTNATEAQLHVYPVQNGSARNLANVLNGLFGQGGGTTNTTSGTGVAPTLTSTTTSTGGLLGSVNTNLSANRTGLGTATNTTIGTTPGTGVTSVNLGNGVRVMADEINNAILVYGLRSDYDKIEAALRRLDVPPVQVLIEASIIEVTLSDDLQYGLQWIFNDKSRNGLTGTGALSRAAGGVLGGATAGFSYSLSNSLGNVRAVLNALADKSLLNVISSPSLMVLDNNTASIAVGNQQPIQSGQTITTGGNISSNITYKDTGVTLSVTPTVNAGNVVTLQIAQGVTDVGPVDSATGQRAFLQRQINSKVAIRSGETLVLGGLIRENATTGKTGLPGLVDLPLIGSLFGTTTVSKARTELLIVLTPRVVRSDQDIQEVSSDLRNRMKGFTLMDALPKLHPTVPSPNTNTTPADPKPALSAP